jgi:polycystin 2
MEFPSTGGILTSWVVRTAKLLRYVSTMDYGVAACEVIFIIFVIYYTIEEILDVFKFLNTNIILIFIPIFQFLFS